MGKKRRVVWFAIVAVAAVIASGCVEDITSDKYEFTVRVDEEEVTQIGDDYGLTLIEAQYYGENDSEAFIEVIADIGVRSIRDKRTVKIGETVEIEKLTLKLIEVNRRERYASFTAKISDTEIDIAPAIEVGEKVKRVAEGAIESATSS